MVRANLVKAVAFLGMNDILIFMDFPHLYLGSILGSECGEIVQEGEFAKESTTPSTAHPIGYLNAIAKLSNGFDFGCKGNQFFGGGFGVDGVHKFSGLCFEFPYLAHETRSLMVFVVREYNVSHSFPVCQPIGIQNTNNWETGAMLDLRG